MNTDTCEERSLCLFETTRVEGKEETSEASILAAEAHARKSKTLQELVYGWTEGTQTVRLCSGIPEEDEPAACFVVLEDYNSALVEVVIPAAEVQSAFPNVQPFEPQEEGELESTQYDEGVCGVVTSYARLLELAVSFVLTEHGDVRFYELEDDSLHDWLDSDEAIRRFEFAKVIWADLALCSDDGMQSEHWTLYVVEENGRPGRVL